MLLGQFNTPLFGQLQKEIALILFAAPPDDGTAFFQLYQEFAQRSGTDMEPFQQLALTDIFGFAENGEDMTLRMAHSVTMKMPADHPFGGAMKKIQQLFIATGFGFAGLRHKRA